MPGCPKSSTRTIASVDGSHYKATTRRRFSICRMECRRIKHESRHHRPRIAGRLVKAKSCPPPQDWRWEGLLYMAPDLKEDLIQQLQIRWRFATVRDACCRDISMNS